MIRLRGPLLSSYRHKLRLYLRQCSSRVQNVPEEPPCAGEITSLGKVLVGRNGEKIVDNRLRPWKLVKKDEKPSVTGKPIEQKIIYSSVLDGMTLRLSATKYVEQGRREFFKQEKERRRSMLSQDERSLLVEKLAKLQNSDKVIDLGSNGEPDAAADDPVSFPYAKFTPLNETSAPQPSPTTKSEETSPAIEYGTSDPDVPASNVPCSGCGALLHCQNTSFPGFIPKEIFTKKTRKQLHNESCQRCKFLKEHNIALNVQVSPDDYPRVLEVIKNQKALAVIVVDLLDCPASIWPGILDIVGSNRPVCVVGNKVDLLPQDGKGYLERIKKSLTDALVTTGLSRANIKHVALVSAKTGYGIEELITKLQTSWGFKGDVYLMGCTNVGKSSLFNALIQSDFCKSQAVDIIQRATVSPWPGTTLNLLKFPILRPTSLRLYERTQRLLAETKNKVAEQKLRAQQLQETKDPKYAVLLGHIGRTFEVKQGPPQGTDPFSVSVGPVPRDNKAIFDPEHESYAESKWCYDTPGTVNSEQILTLLTLEELNLTLSQKLVAPRTLLLKPGVSFFLGGLARIDYLEGPHPIMLTVFSSRRLPITEIETQHADEFYSQALGSELLRVPCGGQERLARWPGLSGKSVTVSGKGWDCCATDLVLSSAGWVAVTGAEGVDYRLFVMTPEARGIFARDPPLLPHAVNLRGKRLPFSPCFKSTKIFVP